MEASKDRFMQETECVLQATVNLGYQVNVRHKDKAVVGLEAKRGERKERREDNMKEWEWVKVPTDKVKDMEWAKVLTDKVKDMEWAKVLTDKVKDME
jgi:hypothetical protein